MRILDLTESNPTAANLPYPIESIRESFLDEAALRYQPDPAGLLPAREPIERHYAARGVWAPASRILLTASSSEAYGFLFKLLCDPGDHVLVPRPSYPLFDYLASLESVTVGHYPLHYDAGWFIDLAALEEGITPRTRALVLVNPNNPTGTFLKSAELESLSDLCRRHGMALISDEVFSDYGFAPDANRIASIAGYEGALSFALSGLSKIAGLPQMKLGWIVVGGPEPLASDAWSRLELIADTYLSAGAPVQHACGALLEAGVTVRNAIRQRTAANLAALRQEIEGSAGRILDVEGGWYATVQVPRVRSEEEWVLALLNDHHVLVQPGYFYDFESEAYLVLSLLTPAAEFAEGARRLRTMLD